MLGLLWSPRPPEPVARRPHLTLYLSDEGSNDPLMDAAPSGLEEMATTWFSREAFASPPPSIAEPFSLQWFLAVEHARYQRHGRWLPELLGFTKHPGENVLCLGHGLGTDGVQYARHGAHVTVCHHQQIHLGLMRRNFELRGLHARFLHADDQHLPLVENSVDVVYYAAVLDETDRPAVPVAEIYRVLKPGGKIVALLPARTPAWWRWLMAAPAVLAQRVGFGTRQTRQVFPQFVNHRLWRRYLRRRHIFWPCRWLPRTLLERLVGRFLVVNAFKPVSTILLRAAA